MRFRGFTLAGWALSALLLAGCEKAGSGRAGSGPRAEPKPVAVARAEKRPMVRALSVTGTLAAEDRSLLSAKVPGRLQRLPADVGSVVREGEILAQIEPRDYELGLQQAAAALSQARALLGLSAEGEADRLEVVQVSSVKQAKAVLDEAAKNQDRVQSLSRSGIASQAEVDTVEATHKVALSRYDAALEEARTRIAAEAQRRAEYELARKKLADASVRAPFDGIIQSRSASVGEYVAVGAPIVELVKTDPLRLRLQVPERECALVRTGQVVELYIEGDTNVYRGRIARLSPALDEQNRMLLAEADVAAQGSLRPGLFARARILVDEHQEGLSVPAGALLTFAGIEKVVVVADGKALEKVVSTGRLGPDWIEILGGLSAGEEVILQPAGLRTGQPVKISKGGETAPGPTKSAAGPDAAKRQ